MFLTEIGSWDTSESITVGLRKILQRKVVENGPRKNVEVNFAFDSDDLLMAGGGRKSGMVFLLLYSHCTVVTSALQK